MCRDDMLSLSFLSEFVVVEVAGGVVEKGDCADYTHRCCH